MATQATPGRIETPPADPTLTIPANNEEPKPVTEATEPLSPQMAALAKQRRALQVKEREIAEREKALSASTTQADVVTKAQLKSDPLSVLLDSGVTYEQLTEAVLARQDDTPIRSLEAKIKALEEGLDKKLSDRDAQTEQQVLAEMQKDATRLAAEGDEFELIRETRSIPVVMELIKQTYHKTGEVLDVTAAMKLVEDELVNDSLKVASYKKVQSQLAPAPIPQPQQQQRQMRTLTNRDTASIPLSPKQRALAAFNGTLKR
jgi:hypothetical protein